jgi:hypothetical protein
VVPNAVLCVVHSGYALRHLPYDFRPWMTVYYYFSLGVGTVHGKGCTKPCANAYEYAEAFAWCEELTSLNYTTIMVINRRRS